VNRVTSPDGCATTVTRPRLCRVRDRRYLRRQRVVHRAVLGAVPHRGRRWPGGPAVLAWVAGIPVRASRAGGWFESQAGNAW